MATLSLSLSFALIIIPDRHYSHTSFVFRVHWLFASLLIICLSPNNEKQNISSGHCPKWDQSKLRSRVLSFVHRRISFRVQKLFQSHSFFKSTNTSSMVLIDNQHQEPDTPQYYYGECESLLANCCSKTRLSSPFKFRTMNRRRRQMAFDMLRQMKLQQQQQEIVPTRAKRRRNKKRFYRTLCCTGKIRSH